VRQRFGTWGAVEQIFSTFRGDFRRLGHVLPPEEPADDRQHFVGLLDHRPDIFEGVKYGLTEGGVTEMLKEKVTYFGIETGSKQLVTVDLVAKDEATMQRARIALEPYFHPRDPDRVLPGVRRFMRAVAPQRLDYREPLENVDATSEKIPKAGRMRM